MPIEDEPGSGDKPTESTGREEKKDRDRKEKEDKRRGKKRFIPPALWSIIERAEDLQEGLKRSKLPGAERKRLEIELNNIKSETKEKPRERKGPIGAIKELIEIIELNLKLDEVEEKIVRREVTETWQETYDLVQKIQEAVKKRQLNRRDAEEAISDLLKRVQERGEKINSKTLRDRINQSLQGLQEIIKAGAPKEDEEDSLLGIMKKLRNGENVSREDRSAIEELKRYAERTFDFEGQTLLDKYPNWTKEDSKRAQETVEKTVNKIFEVIDTNPASDWNTAMTLQDQIKLAEIHRKLLDMGDWGQKLSQKLMSENILRGHLYGLNTLIERGRGKPDDLPKYMAGLGSEVRNTLFAIDGASTAARLWETAFERLLDHYGYVPYEKVAYRDGKSEIAEWVKKMFRDYLKSQDSSLSEEEFKKRWPDWKINRAISVGKGHGLLTLRLVEIAARGKLPDEANRFYSPWAEDFVRAANPTEHFWGKFKHGGPGLAMLHFFLTGEKKASITYEKMLASLKAVRQKDPKKQRFADRLNALAAGGPWTMSGWRGVMAARHIKGMTAKELQHLGTNIAIILLKDRIKVYKPSTKDIDKEKTEAAQKPQIEEIWKRALDYDALQIVREAEIYDEDLKELIAQILPDLEEEKRKAYFKQIAELHVDERMKNLVLLDFLKQTEPQNLESKWKELFCDPKEQTWEKIKILQKRNDFLDQIENQYLLVRETAVSESERLKKSVDLHFSLIKDPVLRQKVETYLNSIQKIGGKETSSFKKLVEKTTKGSFRMGLGNSDAAWQLFDFSAEGHIGLLRRYRDFAAASEAVGKIAGMLSKFAEYQKNPLKFVEETRDLYLNICEYDPFVASEVSTFLLEGFIRACDGDWMVKWLPFPLDRLANTFLRNSFAEKVFGEGARAFTAMDKRNLIKHFHELGMLVELDDEGNPDYSGHNKAKKLFKALGASWPRVAAEAIAKYGPFGIIFIFWMIWEEYNEKVSQAFK